MGGKPISDPVGPVGPADPADPMAPAGGTGADEGTAAIERAVVALRRAQRRRNLARLSERRAERTGEHAALPDGVFDLLDVVESATERGEALTVTEAAAALGVDQPRASRLAAQALQAGLLRREADQRDGRRSLLTLTGDGRTALARIHDFRHRVVAETVAEWPPEDRDALARLLTRFVRDFTHLAEQPGPPTGRGHDRSPGGAVDEHSEGL